MTSLGDSVSPTLKSADGRREFSCFPAAILGFIFNDAGEVLLLCHPDTPERWQVINGAIEVGESPVAALFRETAEEAGSAIRIRPVACVHTFLFRYDVQVRAMLSIAYAATYLGGDVVPGSDMAGSAFRWVGLSEIESGTVRPIVPMQLWLFRRAAAIHSLLKDSHVELEPWEAMTPTEVTTALREVIGGDDGLR